MIILTCTWIPVFKHFRNLGAISSCQQNLTCFYRSELFSTIWHRYGFSTENSGFYSLSIRPRPALAFSMGLAWWVSAINVLDWLHTQFFPFGYFQVRSSNKKHLKPLFLHGLMTKHFMLLLISRVVFFLLWLRLPCTLIKTSIHVCSTSPQPKFPKVRKTSTNFISTLLLYMTWSVMQVLGKTCHKTEPAGTCNCNTYSFSTK